jgi:DNA-directed RNA polymerase subunit RPC12/RpoP
MGIYMTLKCDHCKAAEKFDTTQPHVIVTERQEGLNDRNYYLCRDCGKRILQELFNKNSE